MSSSTDIPKILQQENYLERFPQKKNQRGSLPLC
jgi:hypothetical protein